MTLKIRQPGIIADANILIDYAKSGPDVLRLITKHVQQAYTAYQILDEVDQFDKAGIERLGVEIIELSLSQISFAAEIRETKPSLSGQDAICFVLASDNNYDCIINDKHLRGFCAKNKIECIWGFEIMLYLVSSGKLPAEKAYKTAVDIQSGNRWIKSETVADFKNKLGL